MPTPGHRGLEFPDEWLRIPDIPLIGFYGTFSIKRIWKYDELAPHYARLPGKPMPLASRVFLPVHPGHDNSGFRPNDFFIIPREDGATLRGYLRAAADAGADVVLLTSFNEWPETTVVEPSASWPDPYFYLKVLADWKGVSFTPPPLPPVRLGLSGEASAAAPAGNESRGPKRPSMLGGGVRFRGERK